MSVPEREEDEFLTDTNEQVREIMEEGCAYCQGDYSGDPSEIGGCAWHLRLRQILARSEIREIDRRLQGLGDSGSGLVYTRVLPKVQAILLLAREDEERLTQVLQPLQKGRVENWGRRNRWSLDLQAEFMSRYERGESVESLSRWLGLSPNTVRQYAYSFDVHREGVARSKEEILACLRRDGDAEGL